MKRINRLYIFLLAMVVFVSGIALPQKRALVYADSESVPTGYIYFSADADGTEPIEYIGGFDNVWVNGTVYGDYSTNEDLELYVALYKDGVMLEMIKSEKVSANGTETDFSYEVSGLPQASDFAVKAFLWTADMTPVAECKECKSGIKPHLEGIFEAYKELDIVFDGDVIEENEISQIIWQRADSQNGVYESISGAAGMTYMTTGSDAGKWIKAQMTVEDDTYETEPRQIEEIKAVVAFDGVTTQIGTNEKTPDEYKFTIDGMEFILLETTEDDDAKFLVMTNQRVGVRRYSAFIKYTNDTGYSAESNRKNYSIASTSVDMAAFLNAKDSVNVIIGDGEAESFNGAWKYGTTGEINGSYAHGTAPSYGYLQQEKYWTLLPETVQKYINNDIYWECEPKAIAFEGENFAIKGGIMLLSHSEVEKYSDRIGLWENYAVSTIPEKLATCWWTRSPAESASTYTVEFSALGKTGSRQGHTNGNGGCGIRPAFYLSREVFLENKVDLRAVGETVREEIFGEYTRQELLSRGYTKEELSSVAENIEIYAPSECSPEEFVIRAGFDIEAAVGTEYVINYTVDDDKYTHTVVTDAKSYEKNVSLPVNAVKNGICNYAVTVTRGGAAVAEASGTAYISEPYNAQFLDKYTLKGYGGIVNSDETAKAIYGDGANVVRQSVRWEQTETSKGTYDWSVGDRVIPNMLKNGIEPLIILAIGNALYTGSNENIANTKESIDAFAAYARGIAERYPGVKYFEILNEPNGKSPLDVALLTKVTERELHKIDPDIVILGGSMADGRQEYLSALYRFGEYDYIDAVSNHPYIYYYGLDADDDEGIISRVDRVNKVSENYGGFKESYMTEIGWTTAGTVAAYTSDEHHQAVNLVKQFALADSGGSGMEVIYRHIDNGSSQTNPEHGFGVRDYQGNSKEANLSNRAYFRKMRGAQYFGEMPLLETGEFGYLYIKEKEPLAIMWSKDGTSTHTFTGESLTVYDMYGNVKESGVSSISLSDDPIYVKGFSNRWFNMTVNTELKKKLSYYLENIGQSDKADMFNTSLTNAATVSESSEILSEEVVSGFIDEHFAVASEIIKLYTDEVVSQKVCSALLSALENLGKIWTNYYSLTACPESYEIQSDAAVTRAETMASAIETSAVGARIPYTETMLRMARRYSQNAAEVLSDSEENIYKAGIVKAWDRHALEIAEIVELWIPNEKVTSGNILIQVPTGDAKMEYDKSGTVNVGVYNYSSQDIDGTLKLVDAFGSTIGSAKISLRAGRTKSVAITGTVPSGGANESFVTASLVQNGKEICRAEVMVIKQTERLADTISPAPVFKAETDAADIFTVSGKDYILLDTLDSETSKFMVITKDEFGGPRPLHSAADGKWSMKFETEDENDIGYWLNNTLVSSGKFPAVITDNIDFNHYHLTEGSSYIVDVPYDYQTKAGIAVLSATEAIKYADKVGMLDGNLDSVKASGYNWSGYQYFTWMLRTGRNKHDVLHMMRVIKAAYNSSTDSWSFTMSHEPVNITTDALRAKCRIRPLFYLEEDFFLEAKIPVSSMGENVKTAIAQNYTQQQLTDAGYSQTDLTALGF